jgi:hypothetical protein
MSSGRSGISFKVSKGDFEMRANELRIGNIINRRMVVKVWVYFGIFKMGV